MRYFKPNLSRLFFCLLPILYAQQVVGQCTVQATQSDIQVIKSSNARTTGTTFSSREINLYHHIFLNDQGDPTSTVWSEEIILSLLEDREQYFNDIGVSFNSCFVYHNSSYYLPGAWLVEIRNNTNYPVSGYMNIFYSSSPNASKCAGAAYYPWSQGYHGLVEIDCPDDYTHMLATWTHEIGHAFGLIHTHGGSNLTCSTDELVNGSNCTTEGDLICDTPADPNINFVNQNGCFIGNPQNCTDANGQQYNPNEFNIMSYSWANCRTQFSTEQINSMRYWLNTTYFDPIESNLTNYGQITYSSNTTINSEHVTYDGLTISNSAGVTINACNVTLDNLTINSGSTLTIQ